MQIPKCMFVLASVLTTSLALAISPNGILSAEPRVVHNTKKGLWEGDPSKQLNLATDLEIGKEDGRDNEMFGRIYDIAVNSRGEIYVLDNGFVRVQKYDSAGAYLHTIGAEGEGPGDFIRPTAITIDERDRLYVADQNAITMFDSTGAFIRRFKHGVPGGWVRTVRVTRTNIFVSCFEVLDQKIIHVFDLNSRPVLSFCDPYAVGQDIDLRIESTYAGGYIDLDSEGIIYYTQMTPYEIRIYSPTEELTAIVDRDNDFPAPHYEQTEDRISLDPFTSSTAIIVLGDGKFINTVSKPPFPGPPGETIIDLFDSDGVLLLSKRFEENFLPKCVDRTGRLYAAWRTPYPRVVRYRVCCP